MREHNRLVGEIAEQHPQWDGDRIYEGARRIVGARIQVITYSEFLPLLLGPDALRPYEGYDPSIDATIMNSFSGAAYRLGHSLWYQNALAPDELTSAEETRLADIIRRNTEIADEIGPDVFRVPGRDQPPRQGPGGRPRTPRR